MLTAQYAVESKQLADDVSITLRRTQGIGIGIGVGTEGHWGHVPPQTFGRGVGAPTKQQWTYMLYGGGEANTVYDTHDA